MKQLLHTIKTVLFFAFLLLSVGVNAATYYVATNGNDNNNGSENSPWLTIQKATASVNAGDHVYIKRGTYYNNVNFTKSGNANNWIVFEAYPGDELQVVLEKAVFRIKCSYFRLSGVKASNGDNGIYVEGPGLTDITISNNHTYNSFSSGIVAWGVPYKVNPGTYSNIYNLKILNNKVQKACNGGWNECITLVNGIVGFEISGNEVYDGGNPINGGEGIDIKGGVRDGVIANNYVHNLTRRGIYLDANGDPEFERAFVRNVKVHNNRVHNCVGHGIAVMTEGVGDVHEIEIFNNVLYDNTDDGIMFYKHPYGNGSIFNVKTYNNTIYSNDRWGILLAYPGSYGMEFYNNICYADGAGAFKGDPGDGDYVASNNLYGIDPKFVDVNTKDFHLKASSPAINQAKNDIAPLADFDGLGRSGNADIGAYEYAGVSNPIATDAILAHALPASFNASGSITFTVDYETTVPRDIHVDLQSTSPDYSGFGNAVKTVNGKGTASITFTPTNNPTADRTYRWLLYMTEEGKNWEFTIDGTSHEQVVVVKDISTGNLDADALELTVTPNPMRDFVTIRAAKDIKSIKIYSSNGSLLVVENLNATKSCINTTSLYAGIYLMTVEFTDGKISVMKLTK